ncbi:dof zinc finger protein DOF3.7 [Amborella trichopoda]|uniref:Dof zinc finger protein n=1 Tax=Amborella trichopoda TaxID=13333 RepID=U5D3V2_AMBTC|nr:dof zinc finger protein DOF3.7 [Amborella trichopoda]ERN16082.1 hypothetical protein AMTR_s00030p00156320 [Amborella trichopoda]|eukprot:XP_006854615.1 dof zinc finger protein DOF3.7 [Amborella trichopoda]
MNSLEWQQADLVMVNPLEDVISSQSKQLGERKLKAQTPQSPNCPRCNSTNTKFCYYNNYSHAQPRYFCKTCRRYWTKGGALRNVPVGGGCRKSKKPNSTKALQKPTLNYSNEPTLSLSKTNHGSPSFPSCYVMQDGNHEFFLPFQGIGYSSGPDLLQESKPSLLMSDFGCRDVTSFMEPNPRPAHLGNLGFQNFGSFLNLSMEGLNGYGYHQGSDRALFSLENPNDSSSRPVDEFNGLQEKMVETVIDPSTQQNGMGVSWHGVQNSGFSELQSFFF